MTGYWASLSTPTTTKVWNQSAMSARPCSISWRCFSFPTTNSAGRNSRSLAPGANQGHEVSKVRHHDSQEGQKEVAKAARKTTAIPLQLPPPSRSRPPWLPARAEVRTRIPNSLNSAHRTGRTVTSEQLEQFGLLAPPEPPKATSLRVSTSRGKGRAYERIRTISAARSRNEKAGAD